MKNKKWILNMSISFAFNGTRKEAEEKLEEDRKFLEEEVFTRDCIEYSINNDIVYECDFEKLQDKSYAEEMDRDYGIQLRIKLYNKIVDELSDMIYDNNCSLISEMTHDYKDELYRNSDSSEYKKIVENIDFDEIQEQITEEIDKLLKRK